MDSPVTFRVVYTPWLRPVMRLILPNWTAITLGHTILAGTEVLSSATLTHELVHVEQWDRHGLTFPFRYLWSSLSALLHGQHWYSGNVYEQEASG